MKMEKCCSSSFKPFKVPLLWVFTVLFFAYQFGMRVSIPNVLNEDLQRHFAIGSKELGALISTAYMTYMLMQIPVGIFIDKISLKKIVFLSFFFTSLSLISFVSTKSLFIAWVSQIILGAATASGFAMIYKIANICFPRGKIAIATSLAISLSSLGVVGFGIMMAHLSKEFYWRDVVLVLGTIGLLFSGILLLFVPDIENDTEEETHEHKSGVFDTAKIIFGKQKFLLIGFFSMMIYGTGSAFSETWGVSFIKHIYNVDIVEATSIVTMHFVGIVVGGLILAYFSEILRSYTKMMVIGSSMLFGAIIIIAFGNVHLYLLHFIVFLLGAAASCNTFSFLEAMSLLPKKIGGSVTGTLNTMTMLGSTIMIPTIGVIIDLSRGTNVTYCSADYHCGLLVLVVSSATSVIAALCVRRCLK